MAMIEHYFELQNKYEKTYGDKTIVLYQCGGFFEIYGMYDENGNSIGKIHEISDITNLSVSKRGNKYAAVSKKNPNMAGFPNHSFDKWKNILLKEGYTIIKVEQDTNGCKDPKRRITEILSPGVNIDSTTSCTNNLMSIFFETINSDPKILYIGISIIDVTTGESSIYELESKPDDTNYSLDETFRIIQSYNPSEIVINTENLHLTKDYIISYLEINNINIHYNYYKDKKYLLSAKYRNEILEKSFPKTGMLNVVEYLDLEKKYFGLSSFIFLLQFTYEHNENIIERLVKPKIWDSNKYLILSYDSINQLNIVPNKNLKLNTKIDSLCNLLDKTKTSMGKRFLRESILNPILETDELNKRYNLCENFLKVVNGNRLYIEYKEHLKKIFDIEKLHRKMTVKLLDPHAFINLDISYSFILKIIDKIKLHNDNDNIKNLLPDTEIIKQFKEYIEDYNSKLDLNSINKITRSYLTKSIFKYGLYDDIDKLQDKIDNQLQFFKNLKINISEKIGISEYALNLKQTDKEGHFFSTTKKRSEIFKNTLKKTKYTKIKTNIDEIKIENASFNFKTSSSVTKITCPEIKNSSERLIFYYEKMMKLCLSRFNDLLENYHKIYHKTLKKIVQFVAYIDFITSNAECAYVYHYNKPVINDKFNGKSYINSKNTRHPIIEIINQKLEYIPNDINLGENTNGMLLYGVNAVGKSSYMKSVGLAVVMAQCGMYVSSEQFEYYPYKYLFTRISGNDNIFKGQSTFAVEMSELRSILKRVNQNSLILGDELCSGTETVSGLAIVAAGVITLDKSGCSFIFATHLHQLSKINKITKLEKIKNYHMETIYNNKTGKLIYNRKLKLGSGNAIYGLEVAKAMDLDNDFILLANQIRHEVLGISNNIIEKKSSQYNANVILNNCKICDSKADEVHHMKPQAIANTDGFIDHHHKNAQHNLIQLCHDCHQKVENGDLEILGYIQTSNGIEVNHKKLVEDELAKKKKSRKKYNENQINIVLSYKPELDCKMNYTRTKRLIELNDDLKISTSIIKRIWNGCY